MAFYVKGKNQITGTRQSKGNHNWKKLPSVAVPAFRPLSAAMALPSVIPSRLLSLYDLSSCFIFVQL
jgi:hypothetical protein